MEIDLFQIELLILKLHREFNDSFTKKIFFSVFKLRNFSVRIKGSSSLISKTVMKRVRARAAHLKEAQIVPQIATRTHPTEMKKPMPADSKDATITI